LASGIGAQRVDFVSIPVRDKDRAAKFYAETLGLQLNPLTGDNWPEFETGNVTLAVVVPEALGLEFEPLPFGSVAIRVPDVGEARAKLEAAGIEFERDSFDSGVCHMAFFRDSEGNGLMIHHRYAPYSDGSTP
jgi:catechol 2,3-dioxygenase-like lactoylglutathione lyase family enzyme